MLKQDPGCRFVEQRVRRQLVLRVGSVDTACAPGFPLLRRLIRTVERQHAVPIVAAMLVGSFIAWFIVSSSQPEEDD